MRVACMYRSQPPLRSLYTWWLCEVDGRCRAPASVDATLALPLRDIHDGLDGLGEGRCEAAEAAVAVRSTDAELAVSPCPSPCTLCPAPCTLCPPAGTLQSTDSQNHEGAGGCGAVLAFASVLAFVEPFVEPARGLPNPMSAMAPLLRILPP